MEEEEYPDEEEEVEAEEVEDEGAEEEEGGRSTGNVADKEMADGSIKKEKSDGDGDGEGESDFENEDEDEDGQSSEESDGGRAEQALSKAAQKASVKPRAPAKPPQQQGSKSAGGKGKVKHGWDWDDGPAKTIDQGLDNILSGPRDDASNGSRLLRRSSRNPSTTTSSQTPGHMPAAVKSTPLDVSKTPARKRKRDSFAE